MIQAVFLSYASQDAGVARRICEALRAAGLEVWFDQSELRGGDAWDQSIRKQIKECALFVPIISPNTQAREEGYFRLEWKLAVDRSHLMADNKAFFVPVLIGDVSEPAALVPDKFRERQWSKLNDDSSITAFAARVAKLLASSTSPGKTAPNTAPVLEFGNDSHGKAVLMRPAIAVLPFNNLSANPDDEYFADGITEEIINALSQIEGLKVAARTSCFAFKGKNEDLRVVAEKLGVNSVLEGSVRKAGTRLRVTAQLINAADGCHHWSERYDRELTDVFAMQDELAAAIAGKLKLSMSSQAQLAGQPPRAALANTEAYELLLKGRVLLSRRGRGITESRVCLERAVLLDAGNAEALGLLAECYRLLATYGLLPPKDMMPLACTTADRALAIDPDQQQALTTLGNIAAAYEWDRTKATRIYDKLFARHPASVQALCERAYWVSIVVEPDTGCERAFADLHLALRLDPLNAWVCAMLGLAQVLTGQLVAALASARHAVHLDGGNFTARWAEVISLSMLQRYDEGIAAATDALSMSGRHLWLLAEMAAIYGAQGNQAAAEAIHLELSERAESGYVGWAERAAVAASAGHLDLARSWVRKAVDLHDLYTRLWRIGAWQAARADSECDRILRSSGI
jgi:TolB-like protein